MKINLKKFALLFIIFTMAIGIVACNSEPETQEQEEISVNVAALMGPTGMGMVELMERSETAETDLDYHFTLMGSPDDLVGKIINGEVDIAAVPTNLALVLHNRTEGAVQLAAVNTLGVLYVLENGNSINSIADLEGQTVNISGKGATPDFAFRYLLQNNGLIPDEDVILDFNLQHSDLAAATAAGDVDIALLPQPHVTTALMRNDDLRIALDLTQEWNSVTDNSQLAMGAIIVQKNFAENNKEIVDAFLDDYEQSVNFVNNNQEDAAELMAKHEILSNAAVAQNAIPYSNIVFIDAQEAKPFLQDFYQILFDFEPRSIGGKLADESFYYQR
ncbi:NitT/TauT family transport system substrate-binding protein [Desulfitispora alkaliphila]|uniref:ABC transporter substrate-binding protein n=1 Tax=Desulfitispora alkaliphila TaxID=622674 RepID=UPI003D231F3F